MKPRVYLETTIISYLTARPSRDVVQSACQQMTWMWWDTCRFNYDLFVSERVIMEASQGDPQAAERRLNAMKGLPVLVVSGEAEQLAINLMKHLRLPQKAAEDALHIAIAIVAEMDYLITWNCRHIAQAHIVHDAFCYAQNNGYAGTLLCTPQTLLEDYE